MQKIGLRHAAWWVTAALGFSLVSVGLAQQGGYAVGENANGPGTGDTAATPGPVRMARVSYENGSVAWRPSDGVDWSAASANMPLRQGAEIWAKAGSRAEVQFDDGSIMRVGGDGLATLQTLYSDAKGEFTEIKLTQGLLTLHLKSNLSEFQIDTPRCSVKAYGPAVIRIGVGGAVEVVVRNGEAAVDTASGETTLKAGQQVVLGRSSGGGAPRGSRSLVAPAAAQSYSSQSYNSTSYQEAAPPPEMASEPVVVESAPVVDTWDTWSDERDNECFHQNSYLAANINLCAGNLDIYGSWHSDSRYQHVWCPRVAAGWRPYHSGHWAWVSPVGWTWVPDEPWGYAPCHYGTWVSEPYGWAWVPGPSTQYWSPAVVSFCDDGASVAWVPLAPAEVQYPAVLDIGFRAGNWSLNFSIGQVGCYYPTAGGICVGRPWANTFVNRTTNVYSVTNINNYYNSTSVTTNNVYVANNRFRPINAFEANGATVASHTAFMGGGNFQPLSRTQTTIFQRGRTYVGAPRGSQVSGPLGLVPHTNSSFTATHTTIGRVAAPPPTLAARPVFRAAVPTAIAKLHPMKGRVFVPPVRPATVTSRPATTRPGMGAATVAPANKFNKFNNVSKSPFTNRAPGPPGARPGAARPGGSFARTPAAPHPSRPGLPVQRPATHAAPPMHRAAPGTLHAPPAVPHRAPPMPHRAAPAVNHAAPAVKHAAPVAHRPAPPVRRAAPVVHHAAPAVHHAAPTVHHAAPAVHRAAPAAHHAAPAVHRAPPPVRRSAPAVHAAPRPRAPAPRPSGNGKKGHGG